MYLDIEVIIEPNIVRNNTCSFQEITPLIIPRTVGNVGTYLVDSMLHSPGVQMGKCFLFVYCNMKTLTYPVKSKYYSIICA